MVPDSETTDDETRPVELPATAAESTPSRATDDAGLSAPGRRLGRYVLERELGRGGMSLVYAAFDPQLERQVALKLMKPVSGSRDRNEERLLREAQALARLAHPNVVHVYDVGTVDGQVYVAMELVRGQTLRQWVADTRPSWRQILQMLEPAGRGLAAAHAAGMVHLDFKPSNVLIGEDGRVRVVDFGLARPPRGPNSLDIEEPGPDSDSAELREVDTRSRGLDERLTEVGVVLGTPGFMAPETLSGGVVDAPADQFAFCVAAWRCLFGQLPFAGDRRVQVEDAITGGRTRKPPAGHHVPTYVTRALQRGLSVDPRDRFRSMAALLAALSPSRYDRRRLAGVGAVGVVGLAAAAWFASPDPRVDCTGGEALVAAVWHDDVQQKVARAFAQHPTGAATWEREAPRIEAWTGRWGAAYRDACEATHVRHAQSTELLDRRVLCLDNARARLDAVLEVMVDADAATIEHATQVVDALPEVARCSEEAELLTLERADDEAGRALAADLEREMARASAFRDTGHALLARPLLEQVVARAEAAGRRRQLASARADLAGVLALAGDASAAVPLYDQAIFDAEALGWDTQRLALYVEQVFFQSQQLSDHGRAEWYARAALSLVDRIGGHERERARLLNNRAVAANLRGDYDEALRLAREALEVREQAGLPSGLNESSVRGNAGNALYNAGRHAEALAEYQTALQISLAAVGPVHPAVANDRENLGNALRAIGRTDEAVREYEAAVAILGQLGYRSGARVGNALNNLGVAHTEQDRYEDAAAAYRQAIEAFRGGGPETPPLAAAHINLAEALLVTGDAEAALVSAQEALAMFQRTLPAEHPYVGVGQLGLGNVLVALHRDEEALVSLRAAEPLIDIEHGDPVGIGELHLSMARALTATSPGATEAIEAHLRKAEDSLLAAAPRGKRVLAELRAWRDRDGG